VDSSFADDAQADARDGTLPDASPNACAGGDDRCLLGCVGDDPDCTTSCGDSRCVGNAGELCTTCEADCQTLAAVCGNGHCQTNEAPDCYADCGPTPWTWTTAESDLLAMINAKRVGGHTCPNGTPVTAPALVASMALRPAARDWVWEIAHHEFVASGGGACNGRTFADRQVPVDFDYAVNGRGYASAAAAVEGWFSNESICPQLMSTARTQIATAVALDKLNVHLALLE
jgi:hypothetical protein